MPEKIAAKLDVRNAQASDIEAINDLSVAVYGDDAYGGDTLRGLINHFPEGQFVAVYGDKIIGFCGTIKISGRKAMQPHTWRDITGNGYGTTHDPDGDYLYGVDIFVDPKMRGMRIGERFYRKRRNLCRHLRLRGIIFGGRLPNLAKRIRKVGTPENYIEQVRDKKLRDPVVGFHFRQGFEYLGILHNYLPSDQESLGHAAHMLWQNPDIPDANDQKRNATSAQLPETVRIATVQFRQRGISSFEEFADIIEYFVDTVADYGCDFVLFPELFTLQLLSIENEAVRPEIAIKHLTKYTERIREMFSGFAVSYNVNIIAGSHPTEVESGRVENICYICLRDGTIHEQPKIHPTPNERYWWNIQGSDKLSVVQSDCGPIGVLICYDSEFPELARHLVNQGAQIIFVPFCTDERQSYLRVRYCAQARAVENQCYVVMSGNVGNLPRVHNMDIQYAQSCILTPCDFPFARDGIAADTTPNVETVAFADLRLESLTHARRQGTVLNLKDRRHDLYTVTWKGKS